MAFELTNLFEDQNLNETMEPMASGKGIDPKQIDKFSKATFQRLSTLNIY